MCPRKHVRPDATWRLLFKIPKSETSKVAETSKSEEETTDYKAQ